MRNRATALGIDARDALTSCTEGSAGSPTTARVDVLVEGSFGEHVRSTVSLVRDNALILVVDPGMVRARADILTPLAKLGVSPSSVTDVVITHHHPDHTMNIGLFPSATVHDYCAVYFRDSLRRRPAEGTALAPSVRLIETPGHTAEDITVLARTLEGVVAFTHLWWHAGGPAEDPRAVDMAALHLGRERVLSVADRIVPGHGAAFAPGRNTPR